MSTMGPTAAYDSVLAMPPDLLIDVAAVHVIGDSAAEFDIRLNITINPSEEWTVWVRNGVLNARPNHVADAELTVSGDKAAIATLLLAPTAATKLISAGRLTAAGDIGALDRFAAVMDRFDPAFNLVTP
jgi:alkyl sulfatase BDS1-like metallo-beta-lactamase superfamily hydrolase